MGPGRPKAPKGGSLTAMRGLEARVWGACGLTGSWGGPPAGGRSWTSPGQREEPGGLGSP